jgi:hypothetical protein
MRGIVLHGADGGFDASNVFLDETSAYSFEPIACEIEATTSGLDYRRH